MPRPLIKTHTNLGWPTPSRLFSSACEQCRQPQLTCQEMILPLQASRCSMLRTHQENQTCEWAEEQGRERKGKNRLTYDALRNIRLYLYQPPLFCNSSGCICGISTVGKKNLFNFAIHSYLPQSWRLVQDPHL